jgi:hypothetical protein
MLKVIFRVCKLVKIIQLSGLMFFDVENGLKYEPSHKDLILTFK